MNLVQLATTVMEPTTPSSRGVALELLEVWQRVSTQHVALGMSCGCGAGGVMLLMQDFEQDIVDYLFAQSDRAKRADVREYLDRKASEHQDGRGAVSAILAAFADGGESNDISPAVTDFLLEKLGKTLRSFARLHGIR